MDADTTRELGTRGHRAPLEHKCTLPSKRVSPHQACAVRRGLVWSGLPADASLPSRCH